MVVRKAIPLPVEAVVRGYLSGSGWREYRQTGSVCGIALPTGLRESERLPEPIFTPATKAESGEHDENITFEQIKEIVGVELAERVRGLSLGIYAHAAEFAANRGIIIADTKFEFGMADGELLLIDEALTPDSSRFWPADQYVPGRPQPSFDKQFVRDYLESIGFDKQPPAPELPSEIVEKTTEKYREALRLLTTGGPGSEMEPNPR
jgi:phosphoribosylaminoimidazole-succinocarboxamide synthase